MKSSILFLLLASFAISTTYSYGEDITTRDGNVYKNVYIEGVNPSGIDIGYIDASGVFVLKGVNFSNLPENIQKQYGYVPAKATQFTSKVNQYANSDIDSVASGSQAKVNKIIQEIKAKVSGSDIQIEPADLSYAVFALRRSVTVKPAYAVSTGCVVEVESVKSGKAIPNKKILLDGVNLPGYSSWTGFVYPTGAKANFGNDKGIPVFTDNLDRSVQILKKYLNIYGEYAANNVANPVNTDASASSSVATDAPDLSQNSYASQNPPSDNSQPADNSQTQNTQSSGNSQQPVQNNYYYGNDGNYNDGYGFTYYMGGGYYPVDWYRRNRYNPYNPHHHYPHPLYRNDEQKKVPENRELQNREQANKQLENRERVNRSAASSRENIDSFAKNYYGERTGNFHQSNYNRSGEGGEDRGSFYGGEHRGGEQRGGFSGGRGGGRR